MYHRVTYQSTYPILALESPKDIFLEHRYFILDDFRPNQGHLMLEGYDAKTISLLVAFPSYLDPKPVIMQRVRRYLDALLILDRDDFDEKHVHIKRLNQTHFFEALVQASLQYSHETQLGIFYQTYFFEQTSSMEAKVITLPTVNDTHIQMLVKEEGDNLSRIVSSFSKDQKPELILLNEPNYGKAEAWFQWLALQRNHQDGFYPSAQWKTRIRIDMPMGDLIHLCREGFIPHLLGQQWIIELNDEALSYDRFSDLLKRMIVSPLEKNMGIGQIIVHNPGRYDIHSWFNQPSCLEIRDICCYSQFENEPEWAL